MLHKKQLQKKKNEIKIATKERNIKQANLILHLLSWSTLSLSLSPCYDL